MSEENFEVVEEQIAPAPEVELEVVVEEPEPVVEEVVYTPEPEVEVEIEPAVVVVEEVVHTPAPEVLSTERDTVVLSKLSLASKEKKSKTVALVQNRLIGLGFVQAGEDNIGTFGVNTAKALADYAGCEAIGCDFTDETMIKTLFSGTAVEVIN